MTFCTTCGSVLEESFKEIRCYDGDTGKPIFHVRKTCPKLKKSWWLKQINNSGPNQLHMDTYFVL